MTRYFELTPKLTMAQVRWLAINQSVIDAADSFSLYAVILRSECPPMNYYYGTNPSILVHSQSFTDWERVCMGPKGRGGVGFEEGQLALSHQLRFWGRRKTPSYSSLKPHLTFVYRCHYHG